MNKTIFSALRNAGYSTKETESLYEKVLAELEGGGKQNHPFHMASVLGHTELVVLSMKLQTLDPRMWLVALLHDIGKASVKSINPKTGYDSFFNHAKASVEWCNENGVVLSDEEKDLILEHDNCKSWVNGKKLNKLIRKHGEQFRERLAMLVQADMDGQSDKACTNKQAITNIKEW